MLTIVSCLTRPRHRGEAATKSRACPSAGRGGEVGSDRVDARLRVDHDATDVAEHLGLVDHADVRVGARDGDRLDPGLAAAGVDDRDGLGPGVEHEARHPEVDHHALTVAAEGAHEGAGRGIDAAEAGQLLEERAVVDDEQQGLALHFLQPSDFGRGRLELLEEGVPLGLEGLVHDVEPVVGGLQGVVHGLLDELEHVSLLGVPTSRRKGHL